MILDGFKSISIDLNWIFPQRSPDFKWVVIPFQVVLEDLKY